MKNTDWADNENRRPLNDTALDRELDAALAKFATVEPRAGLEERILASLSAQQVPSAQAWWRWPALVVSAAVMLVAAVSLVWRSAKPAPDAANHQPPTAVHSDKHAANDATSYPVAAAATKKPARHSIHHPQAAVASAPRLEQFPSPRPLSEEETLLLHYVQRFPQEALMIAKEQWEFEQQMENPVANQTPGTNSDQHER